MKGFDKSRPAEAKQSSYRLYKINYLNKGLIKTEKNIELLNEKQLCIYKAVFYIHGVKK